MNLEKDASSQHEQEILMKMICGLQKLTLNNKPHIKEYYRIRGMHQEIVDSMIKYYQDGKFEQKIDPGYVLPGDNIPLIQRETTYIPLSSSFNLNTRQGAQTFYDMMIYKPAPNMNCITEEFIQNQRYKRQDKVEFLHSMLSSKLGLFAVTNTEMSEGYVFLKEVFTGEEFKITDVGLSGNYSNEGFYIYTRIITYRDVSFNTGLGMFFAKDDGFIENYITIHKKDYKPDGQLVMLIELYNQYMKYPNKFTIVTNEI